jgi:glycosyltransferase involved in cell wall biosynthesis
MLARAARAPFDLVIVAFRAHSDALAASLVARARGVPLIFDPLVSRYEERVVDRRQVSERSWLARWYKSIDAIGCRVADRLLLETEAQIAYFAETFGIAASKCRRLWLGADDEIMRPYAVAPRDVFTVFFYGRFSPLHGVEHIIDAAAQLERRAERVRMVLVGGGQTHRQAVEQVERLGVTTVSFVAPVPYHELPRMMSAADLCLGSFGTTARAQRVIPYKVFDALAVGRPVLTGDSAAVREGLAHGRDVWLTPCGNGAALADAIVHLKSQPELRTALARNGQQTFLERFSLEALTRDLAAIVSHVVGEHGAHPVSR